MPLTMLPSLEIDSWSQESLSNLTENILNTSSRPLILIDGAAGSGKTTLAVKLAEILDVNLVHSDDVSWCADPIHWDGEMLDGIINPWLSQKEAAYRPSGWIKENRSGAIEVDPGRPLIIEGMGASRKTLRTAASYSIWVDTEPETARARVVQRDLANGENGATIESVTKFAEEWDAMLIPLFMEEESWKHVDVIVSGSQSDPSFENLRIHVWKN